MLFARQTVSDRSCILALGAALLLSFGVGCQKAEVETEKGAAPPPIEAPKPGACTGGGGKVTDEVSAPFFPRSVGGYCVDPNAETRAYGEDAPGSIDKVCTELFDGECEVYKRYGLERVVTLRYIDGAGSPATVNVNLSRFDDRQGAFAFYTQRVVADADPEKSSLEPLSLPGSGALGGGIAYVWRGEYVAELSYANELQTPDQLKASSKQVLPPIAQQLAEKLPGDAAPPPAAALLPEEGRIRLGVSYHSKDALDVKGAGPGALGYYKDGEKRWRILSIVAADDAAAKDIMKSFGKLEGAKPLKDPRIDALGFHTQADESGPRIHWLLTRKGSTVLGVGDEEFVLGDAEAAEAKQKSLSLEEKIARLRDLPAAGAKPEAEPADAGAATAKPAEGPVQPAPAPAEPAPSPARP